jgi:hypothetical protein
MRINVYAEELTRDVEIITKIVDDRKFYAVRLYLHSANELHHSEKDDDRSAITFWVPWYDGKNHHDDFIAMMNDLLKAAQQAEREDIK